MQANDTAIKKKKIYSLFLSRAGIERTESERFTFTWLGCSDSFISGTRPSGAETQFITV